MNVETKSFSVTSHGHTDIIDITKEVKKIFTESGMAEGNITVFAPGSTAGITTIEYEPGLLHDYPAFFEKIIPSDAKYRHDETWHDGNGHSHVRAALQGASFVVPFAGAKLLLGTWQQIILVDFDARPRDRQIVVQLIGK